VNSETLPVTFAEAVRCALEDAMAQDESIVLLGQDAAAGFPFGATRGLAERFGAERVRDTPISEAATMGCAIGAATMGVRTVVEVDFAGFLLLGLDQLVNNAAKLRYMSGGQLRVPLVVRVGQGPLGGFAAQHSQTQHAWLASVPGLAVVAPSDAQDAYTLMRWALAQRDPVVVAEDMRLYRTKGRLVRETARPQPTAAVDLPAAAASAATSPSAPAGPAPPPSPPAVPPAVPPARIVRPGHDATVLSYGFGTTLALAAARELAATGVETEVIDLRVLAPLDVQTIGAARHTGRVLCLGDDPLLGGITATLAATVDSIAHGSVVARLGARHWPTPFASEAYVYPSTESVVAGVRRLLAWPEAADAEIVHGDFQIASAA
jgi:acetoin:2,6-dichlorophenolindophenol oxidoreductase subunit beta